MIAAKRVPVNDAVQERACESGHKPSPEDQPDKFRVRHVVAQLRTARWIGFIVSQVRQVEELVRNAYSISVRPGPTRGSAWLPEYSVLLSDGCARNAINAR
jgi:hypothetical protein